MYKLFDFYPKSYFDKFRTSSSLYTVWACSDSTENASVTTMKSCLLTSGVTRVRGRDMILFCQLLSEKWLVERMSKRYCVDEIHVETTSFRSLTSHRVMTAWKLPMFPMKRWWFQISPWINQAIVLVICITSTVEWMNQSNVLQAMLTCIEKWCVINVQSLSQSINQSIPQLYYRPINQSIKWSIPQLYNQSINPPTHQLINLKN